MRLCVRLVRGLGVAGLVLGGIVVGAAIPASLPTAEIAAAQSADRRRGQPPGRSRHHPLLFPPAPGERLDAAKIDEGLKALYATGLFQDVRISQAGGRLVVTVVENPVINRVAFEGNRRSRTSSSTPKSSRSRAARCRAPTVQADVQRIVEIYRRSGRFDVRVEPKIIELPNNRVDLVFEINEGDKTGVRKINFVGNSAYSTYRLKDVIKTVRDATSSAS